MRCVGAAPTCACTHTVSYFFRGACAWVSHIGLSLLRGWSGKDCRKVLCEYVTTCAPRARKRVAYLCIFARGSARALKVYWVWGWLGWKYYWAKRQRTQSRTGLCRCPHFARVPLPIWNSFWHCRFIASRACVRANAARTTALNVYSDGTNCAHRLRIPPSHALPKGRVLQNLPLRSARAKMFPNLCECVCVCARANVRCWLIQTAIEFDGARYAGPT